jgi:hypothetical protein
MSVSVSSDESDPRRRARRVARELLRHGIEGLRLRKNSVAVMKYTYKDTCWLVHGRPGTQAANVSGAEI